MAYDVASLTTTIRTKAKDPSLTDSDIMEKIQETQDEVLGHYRFSFLETTHTLTLAISDLTSAYPADLQTILGLKLDDGTQVSRPDYLTYAEFDLAHQEPSAATAGRPCDYTDYGRTLYWDRPLDKAYERILKYLRRPVTLASGASVPDIPVEYKRILIYGPLGRIEEERENFDIAALHFRKVEDAAEDFLQRYADRQLVTPHRATLNGRRVGVAGRGRSSAGGW